MKSENVHKVINFIAVEAGWFGCVLGAALGAPWFGLLVVCAVVTLHLVMVALPARELKLMGVAAAFGLVFDSLLLNTGWLAYPNGFFLPGVAPYWIVAMWISFSTCFNVSMRWLHGRRALAAITGALLGPMSYYAGAELGGVTLVNPVAAMVALSIGWFFGMPLMMAIAERFDGTIKEAALSPAAEGVGRAR